MERSVVIGLVIAVVVLLGGLSLVLYPGGQGQERVQGRPPATAGAAPASPAAPAPTLVERAAPVPPSFDIVRIEPDGSAVIAGRATPGARVTILDGGAPLGTVTADARGEWVLLPGSALAPGGRDLTLESTTPDGETLAGRDTVTLVVPAPKRDIAGRVQGETGEPLAVLTPESGPTRVLQVPAAGPRSAGAALPAGEVVIDTIDYDREGRFAVGGRGRPGADIQLYLDQTLIGRATAGPGGRWSLSPDRPAPPGRYTLRADQIGADGKVAARAEVPFERRELGEETLGGRAVVVLPGNNLWAIARRSYGAGPRYTVIFEANQEQIRDPDLIYPGQIFILPATEARR